LAWGVQRIYQRQNDNNEVFTSKPLEMSNL